MSEETPAPPTGELPAPVREYLEKWAESLGSVLGQIAGSAVAVESVMDAPPQAAPGADDIMLNVTAAGGLRGEMSLRLSRTVVLSMAQLLLGEAQEAGAEFKPDHQEAAQELFRQIAGHATTALKPRWGEVQLHVELGGPVSWSSAATGWLVAREPAPCKALLEWQVSAALNAALLTAESSGTTPEPEAAAGSAETDEPTVAVPKGNLDLLMDVELGITLRFGQRRMLLREVLELGTGSVVELDRRVEEPVDLLLDGRLIARGEVVVVAGNYGLRVLEVLSPSMA